MLESKKSIRVITYGTFDLLHYGHIRLLKRAKEMGDYLIVAISTDEFNAIKGKKAYHSYETRKKMLEAIRYVGNSFRSMRKDVVLRSGMHSCSTVIRKAAVHR